MKRLGARPEYNNELEPALREEIARVIVDDAAAGRDNGVQMIEARVFIDNKRVELLHIQS